MDQFQHEDEIKSSLMSTILTKEIKNITEYGKKIEAQVGNVTNYYMTVY